MTFSDAYIVEKEAITAEKNGNRNNDGHKKPFVLKNIAPFIHCILKINDVLVDNAEDLDVVMPMFNLIDTVKITDSFWNYYRDEPDNYDIRNSESFKYKTNITGNTPDNYNTTDAEIIVPLQHLSN